MSAKVPLWCRCGTDKTPIPCVGGCGYLCQLLPNLTVPAVSDPPAREE